MEISVVGVSMHDLQHTQNPRTSVSLKGQNKIFSQTYSHFVQENKIRFTWVFFGTQCTNATNQTCVSVTLTVSTQRLLIFAVSWPPQMYTNAERLGSGPSAWCTCPQLDVSLPAARTVASTGRMHFLMK